MKTSKAIRFGPTLLGLLLLSATAANAHTVQSRPACGVVERLDTASRTVQFAPKHGKVPTERALTSQTKFVHNWHFAPADELKDGSRAMVYQQRSKMTNGPAFNAPHIGQNQVTNHE